MEMKASGASNLESAAQQLSRVMPISLQPAQTGISLSISELLEKWKSLMGKQEHYTGMKKKLN